MVTKGGHPRGGGPYGTSGTIGRGVAELYKKFSTVTDLVLLALRLLREDI